MATPAMACVCVSQVWSPEQAEQPERGANSSAVSKPVAPLRHPRAGTSGSLAILYSPCTPVPE